MRRCSIDFGGSTIDVIHWDGPHLRRIQSFERTDVSTRSLREFVRSARLELSGEESIWVTGGKSRRFESEVAGRPVNRLDEIQAIGRGGSWLLQRHWEGHGTEGAEMPNDFLVVSLGTGTCMVAVRGEQCTHVGGTGVGGGTFRSLCQLLLGESDPDRLIALFERGDRRKVDLSVGDIVGDGIGIVLAETTASNLGKVATGEGEIRFEKADLAAGISNLVGQTVATAAIFGAKSERLNTIVLTGKLTRIPSIVETIFEVGKLYGRTILLPEDADYVSAIGCGTMPRSYD